MTDDITFNIVIYGYQTINGLQVEKRTATKNVFLKYLTKTFGDNHLT